MLFVSNWSRKYSIRNYKFDMKLLILKLNFTMLYAYKYFIILCHRQYKPHTRMF